jgi:hypothetical protein
LRGEEMTAQYVVVQYVPDPVIDERVNIGVIVFGGGVWRSRFLDKWKRVEFFGKEKVDFLKGFAKAVDEADTHKLKASGWDWGDRIDEDILRQISGRWMNSIQFTSVRASLLPAEQLLDEMARRFLREPVRVRRPYRDRRVAAGLAATKLRAALQQRLGRDPVDIVKRNESVQGQFDQHKFDVLVTNGAPFLAAQGLSFETANARELVEEQYRGTAWALDDVKNRNTQLRLCVVALPPRGDSSHYVHARTVFKSLGAVVVEEGDVEGWATDVANEYPT